MKLQETLQSLMLPSVYLVLILSVIYTLRVFVMMRLRTLSARTGRPALSVLLSSSKTPSNIWCLMLGIYIWLYIAAIPEDLASKAMKALFVLGVVSVTIMLSSVSSGFISIYSERSDAPSRLSTLSRTLINVVIFLTGALIILTNLGISIAPMLATLGVGGLAVALGLQETLSNLFAGFYIIANRQIRVNDYIRLESGQEGYITDINWRTTKIRMLANNVVLVPNAKLAQTIVTNYYLPDKELAVLVDLGVHYDSDLRHVEKVSIETATEIMSRIPGGVSQFKPFIRYNTFGDHYIGFTVILRGKEFVDQYLIKHEFIMALHERFKKEGIVIPYPIRAINYQQEAQGGSSYVD